MVSREAEQSWVSSFLVGNLPVPCFVDFVPMVVLIIAIQLLYSSKVHFPVRRKQWTHSSCDCMHKTYIKPDQAKLQNEKRWAYAVPPYDWGATGTDSCKGRGVNFLRDAPWETTWRWSKPCTYCQHKMDKVGFKNNTQN